MNSLSSRIQEKNKRSLFKPVLVLSAVFFLLQPDLLRSETKFTILLTSNLQGRFTLVRENQDENDPMLLIAQSIIKEREIKPYDIYLDLGNAFYPGNLSRYSYGSVMMDFLDYFNCNATLVSSRDISIGLSNLEFLSKGRNTKMLSANIVRDGKPVFIPYIELKHSGKKIGIIGVSSTESFFDIADKKVLNISFGEYRESIKEKAEKLRADGCDNVILLSGLSYRNNIELMNEIPGIDLVVSGGDSSGSLFSVPASRVDLQWGRSVITLQESDGFYRLELGLGDGIDIKGLSFSRAMRHKTADPSYRDFTERLSRWKENFEKNENRILAENIPETAVTDETVANMLRHRYRSEIGIIEKNSVQPKVLSSPLYYSSILTLLNNDYPVFTYWLTGADLKYITDNGSDLVITGIVKGRVQNYPVSDTRKYSVCSTQFAYDRISRLLRKHVEFHNTWKTLQDEIEEDIKSERSLTSGDFNYLDERFRMLLDISLSNFYDRSVVRRGENIDTPPGKPEETYRRWGMENTINLTLYNRNHQIVLTPYIYFIKQDEEYQQNLFRGTLLYTYSPNSLIRPYHKSQVDTVLVRVDERPILARETVGLSLNTERVMGRFGAGFEKQIQDPVYAKVYGIETLLDVNYPFTESLKYSFKFDSFISLKNRESEELKSRTEISNALSFKFNSVLGVSVKYKWFHLYSKELMESYKYSQVLLSMDLSTDFKIF